MKTIKTCTVAGITLKMTQEAGERSLMMGRTNVPLEEVKELVEWLQVEVLATSVKPTIPLSLAGNPSPVPTMTQDAPTSISVPTLDDRNTGRLTKDGIPVIESAIKPGEIDPFEGRKVSADAKGKYKALTSIPKVDLRGMEQASGYVETPIRVKV